MERLRLLSQDKVTLVELKDYLRQTLEKKLIAKAMRKEDVSGFAEANEIIKTAMEEIDNMFKVETNKKINLNQSE